VIRAVEQVTEKPVAYRLIGRRPGDPPALVANAENATMLLGWKPRLSDIQTTISTAWNWSQSRSTKQDTL
jgi:UDP-arabinose 4-epimerase